MSAVGRVIAGIVVTGLGIGFQQAWLIEAGASLALGGAAQMLVKPPKSSLQGLNLTANITDPSSPLPVVYGRSRIGINRIYAHVADNHDAADNANLWIVGALCHGPIHQVESIYIDQRLAFTVDANDPEFPLRSPDGFYTGYVAIQVAYGTDGQVGPEPRWSRAVPISSVTGQGDNTGCIVTTVETHSFVVGDQVVISGNTNDRFNGSFGVTQIIGTGQFRINHADATDQSGTRGTVDIENLNLAAEFPTEWTNLFRGRGIAYLVMRFTYDQTKFPSGVPAVEVVVRGRAIEDTRTTRTLTNATVAAAGAVGVYSSHALVTKSGHGFTGGEIIYVTGSPSGQLDGWQRVGHVDSTSQFRLFAPFSGSGTIASIATRIYSTNNAMCVRDYLLSDRYGVGATTEEINEDAFQTEADYCDEQVAGPANFYVSPGVLSGTSGVSYTVETDAPHNLSVDDEVRFNGTDGAALDGFWNVASVVDDTHFTLDTFTVPDLGPGGRVQQQFTAARYDLSGVCQTTQPVKTVLSQLLSSFRAQLIFQGGTYRTFTRRPVVASDFELTPDNIIGDWSFAMPGQEQVANIVVANFVNDLKNFTVDTVQFPPVGTVNGFLADDNNFPLRHEIDLPFTTRRVTAQQIAMITRRESRAGLTAAVTCNESALQCAVGDVIPVTHPTPGWVKQRVWVSAIAVTGAGQVRLALQQYDETAYDLDAQDDVLPAPATTLPDPQSVAPPRNIAVTTDVVTSSLVIAWDAALDVLVKDYQVQYRRSGTSTWTAAPSAGAEDALETRVHVEFLVPYDAKVRAVNAIGAVSDWVEVDSQTPTGGKPLEPAIQETIDATTGVMGLTLIGPAGTTGFKVLVNTEGKIPADTEVRATTLLVAAGRTATIASAATLTQQGQRYCIKAFAYTDAGVESDPEVKSGIWTVNGIASVSIGTATVTETSITFPVTMGPATTRVDCYYLEYASDPGDAVPVDGTGAVPANTPLFPKNGLVQTVTIPMSAPGYYVLFTIVETVGLVQGTPVFTKAQAAAAPPASPPPDIPAASNASIGNGTVTNHVTMPSTITNVGAIRVYRNGVVYGSDIARTAGAGAVQSVTHNVGLAAGATYTWTYKAVASDGTGNVSTNFSPTVTTAMPGGGGVQVQLPAPTSVVAGSYDTGAQSYVYTLNPASGMPPGTTYRCEESVNGGAYSFLMQAFPGDNTCSHPQPPSGSNDDTSQVRVRAECSGYTSSNYTTASVVDIPPEGGQSQ